MANSWYQCKYCGTAVTKESTPNQGGCSAGSSHYWTRLGDVGDISYNCRDCNTTVQTKSTPQQSGCPKANSHYWKRL